MKKLIVLFMIFGLYGFALAEENLIFDEPAWGVSGVTNIEIAEIRISPENRRIRIKLMDKGTVHGKSKWITYGGDEEPPIPDGQTAIDLIVIINTKDFSPPNDSFKTVILKRLIADGKIPSGTVGSD